MIKKVNLKFELKLKHLNTEKLKIGVLMPELYMMFVQSNT
jgi:hypothetical protein